MSAGSFFRAKVFRLTNLDLSWASGEGLLSIGGLDWASFCWSGTTVGRCVGESVLDGLRCPITALQ